VEQKQVEVVAGFLQMKNDDELGPSGVPAEVEHQI
jgi:hypothetical protein